MSAVFGPEYAAAYDLLYAEKDYSAECDAIERAFRDFALQPVRSVLDLGCGTGGHAIPLAQRGYRVTGIDRSPEMLAIAQQKAAATDAAGMVLFQQGDLRSQPTLEPCDAAIMMFAVLGYLSSDGDQLAVLRATRRNLREGGLLVLDAWSAPAVERNPPAQRWRVVEHGDGRTIRLSDGLLERDTETCHVTFRVIRIDGDRVSSDVSEVHRMRYYRAEALRALLGSAGLELVRLGRFPEFWLEPEDDWSVMVIARAV